jgi:hypothetical protein
MEDEHTCPGEENTSNRWNLGGKLSSTPESLRFGAGVSGLCRAVTRVNSTNVQYEGLRIGGIGHRMNSKVKSVKHGVYRK